MPHYCTCPTIAPHLTSAEQRADSYSKPYKGWIFLVSGILIALSGVLTFRPMGRVACSITGGHGCEDAGRFAKWMFWLSAVVWSVGAFFSYAIVPILRALEG